MNLDGTWECLLAIEFFSKQLGKHLIDSNISQKEVIVLQKLPLVLELSEVTSKSIIADNFSNARNIKFCDLFTEIAFWVFDNDANSSVIFLAIESLWQQNLHGSWSWLGWDLGERETDVDE
jgi:hypothetical protein